MAAFGYVYFDLMLIIDRSIHKQLARQFDYLKCENQVLRSRITERIILTRRERNCL
jgi:putative transposase